MNDTTPLPGTEPSSVLLLLTHDDDSTLLVQRPDVASAERVGSAAMFNDGGVVAWRVPTHAHTDLTLITAALHDGSDLSAILDALSAAGAQALQVR